MGTQPVYDAIRPHLIKYGGVGCRVCWRWMDFNVHEQHKNGKKHKANMKEQRTQVEPPGDGHWTAFPTPETVFEIMFPAASHKQTMFTSDPKVNLKGMNDQLMCASDPVGDLEPTDADRAAFAASQAAAEDEWRISQAGPVEGKI